MNTINERSDPCHPLNVKELNTYLPKLSLVANSTCKKVTFPRGTKKKKKKRKEKKLSDRSKDFPILFYVFSVSLNEELP